VSHTVRVNVLYVHVYIWLGLFEPDIGQGEGNNDQGLNYHESEPLNMNVNQDPNDVDNVTYCARNNEPAFEV
jgi:hypothetical protein